MGRRYEHVMGIVKLTRASIQKKLSFHKSNLADLSFSGVNSTLKQTRCPVVLPPLRFFFQSSQPCVLVQEAICTAGELFLAAHKGFQRQALLPARARDEGMSAGELLFDKLPGADSAATEADAWQVSYR